MIQVITGHTVFLLTYLHRMWGIQWKRGMFGIVWRKRSDKRALWWCFVEERRNGKQKPSVVKCVVVMNLKVMSRVVQVVIRLWWKQEWIQESFLCLFSFDEGISRLIGCYSGHCEFISYWKKYTKSKNLTISWFSKFQNIFAFPKNISVQCP